MRAAVGVSAILGIVATLIAINGAAFYWFDEYDAFGMEQIDSYRITMIDLFDLERSFAEKSEPPQALPVILGVTLAVVALTAVIALTNLFFVIPQKIGSIVVSWVIAAAATIMPVFVLIMCIEMVDPLNGIEGPAPGMLVLGGAALGAACVFSLGVHGERERRREVEYALRKLDERSDS